MTAEDAAEGKIHPAEDAVALYRLKSVSGTCGDEATAGRKQGRDKVLIAPDQTEEKPLRQMTDFRFSFHLISLLPT